MKVVVQKYCASPKILKKPLQRKGHCFRSCRVLKFWWILCSGTFCIPVNSRITVKMENKIERQRSAESCIVCIIVRISLQMGRKTYPYICFVFGHYRPELYSTCIDLNCGSTNFTNFFKILRRDQHTLSC
jgi:hypothetical protein